MKKYLLLFLLLPGVAYSQHGVMSVFKQIQQNNMWHAYGGFEDSSVAISITQDQWSMVTNVAQDLWSAGSHGDSDGITLANDTMVVANAGDYAGLLSMTFYGTNANEYDVRVYSTVQDAQMGYKQGASGRSDNNYISVVNPLYFTCVANDSLVLQVTNISGNNSATFKFAEFYLYYVKD